VSVTAQQALMQAIRHKIDNHPRSQQKRIGPSEIGNPCDRRLGYKLLGHPENPRGDAWKPTVGTAVHSWLEEALDDDDQARVIAAAGLITDDQLTWLTEKTVTVGYLADGTAITGSCDAYHQPTRTLIDHKVVGLASLRDKKANGPGQQYRIQVHLYAAGFVMAGIPVEHVAINFLPQNGNLSDAHWWTEPFDFALAAHAIARLRAIEAHITTAGEVEGLNAVEAWCEWCPFHTPGATDLTTGCPGLSEPRRGGGFAHMVEAPPITKETTP
jgi:hypothetical protein